MAIIFSTNPLDWYATDGISVNEQNPAPAARLVGSNDVKLVGQFPWGPKNVETVIDADNVEAFGQFLGQYSDPATYGGVRAIVGKTFGTLRIVAIEADDAVKATRVLSDTAGPTAAYDITAKYSGAPGNEIETKHTNNGADFDLEIRWGTYSAKYEGLTLGTLDTIDDKYVDVVVNVAGGGIPDTDPDWVTLASGSDGTIADEEYIGGVADVRGLRVLESSIDGGIVILAEYTSAAAITALALHIADKRAIGIIDGDADGTDLTAGIAAAQAEASDRLVILTHGAKQTIDGTQYNVGLAAFAASLLSQVPPHYSLADDEYAATLLAAIDDVADGVVLGRANWILAENAGGVMLERREQGGFKFHHPIATDRSLVSNRRVKDIAGLSAAKALLPFQNKPSMPEFNEPSVRAIGDVIDILKGQGGIPASKIIADGSVSLSPGAVEGSDLYTLKVLLWGEKRYQVLTLVAGESVVIEG